MSLSTQQSNLWILECRLAKKGLFFKKILSAKILKIFKGSFLLANHCTLVCTSSFTGTSSSLCPLLAALSLSALMRRTREPRARICKLLRSPGIDSKKSIPLAYVAWRPVRQIGLSYWRARLGIDSWATWKVYKYGLCAVYISISIGGGNKS